MAKSRYVDLRAGHAEQGTSESFWPAFADIMSVVVMIFLMALMVLVVKNWQLVQNLQESLAKERAAMQTIAAEKAVSADLAGRLAELEERVGELQLLLLQARQEGSELQEQLSARDQAVRALTADKDALTAELAVLGAARIALDSEKRDAVARATELEANVANLSSSLAAAEAQSEELRKSLATASEDYASLKVKYDKLVRPARSPSGKRVVELHYTSKRSDKPVEMKLPGETAFKSVSLAEMHEALGPLKSAYPDSLYMKIVFPEGSAISHKEAWDFTSAVLERYDYYYQ